MNDAKLGQQVVHLTADDVDPAAGILCEMLRLDAAQPVVRVGRRRFWGLSGPVAPRAIAAARLMHVWSPTALRGARALLTHDGPSILVEASVETLPACLQALGNARTSRRLWWVCHDSAAMAALTEAGLNPSRCALIAQPVLGRDAALRSAVRKRLSVRDEETVVAVLPPTAGDDRAHVAAWAVLLAAHAGVAVRLLVIGADRVTRRARRFVEAGQMAHMALFVEDGVDLREQLAAADVAMYVPETAASTGVASAAVASGLPAVVSDVGALRAALGDAPGVAWCRPHDAKSAAQALMRVLEREPDSAPVPTADPAADVCAAYARRYDTVASSAS